MESTKATLFQTAVTVNEKQNLAKAQDWLCSVLSFTTKDVGNRCRHFVQHFTRHHYRLDKEGIANAQLALYLAKYHNTKARLESCETCREGLLLILK